MQRGVFTESYLNWLVSCVLWGLLLVHMCLAAPGLTGSQREETEAAHLPSDGLHNPFGSGEEERELLQSYIQANLKSSPEEPEISTREQEVFFLFRLYDFDRSGFLDGLEMMKLLSDYNSHHSPGAQASEQVVSMVDFLLQTQDLNQDGLLTPSELLSPALTHTQELKNSVATQEEREEEPPNTNTEEEQKEEEVYEPIQPQKEKQPQHRVKAEEQEDIQQIEQYEEQRMIEAETAAKEEQAHRVPVHLGQPEI